MASLKIPSENNTACNVGYFYGFINELAAIVSVAQNIAERRRTYCIVNKLLNHPLTRYNRADITIKARIVPIIPKYVIIVKF